VEIKVKKLQITRKNLDVVLSRGGESPDGLPAGLAADAAAQ
jgi:hypothetical protein